MAKSTLPVNFKDDVLASSMGGKRRYKLIHNSDGTVSLEDATTYTQVGSSFGAAQVNATNTAVNASLATDGNGSNLTNTFTQASARSNLSTGEKLSVSLGKIMKYFADLGASAFRSVANNLTTSSAGSSVLDAYQGYLLNSNKVNNSNIIDTLADVIANTQSKKPAGSLALKSAYNELNGKLKVKYSDNGTPLTIAANGVTYYSWKAPSVSGYTPINVIIIDSGYPDQFTVTAFLNSNNVVHVLAKNNHGATLTAFINTRVIYIPSDMFVAL